MLVGLHGPQLRRPPLDLLYLALQLPHLGLLARSAVLEGAPVFQRLLADGEHWAGPGIPLHELQHVVERALVRAQFVVVELLLDPLLDHESLVGGEHGDPADEAHLHLRGVLVLAFLPAADALLGVVAHQVLLLRGLPGGGDGVRLFGVLVSVLPYFLLVLE